jgi:hypothetical protein
MAHGFARGLYMAPPRPAAAAYARPAAAAYARPAAAVYAKPAAAASDALPANSVNREDFLLLVVLFILLAASPSLGVDSKYFFIIILAGIGVGGFKKAFGLSAASV